MFLKFYQMSIYGQVTNQTIENELVSSLYTYNYCKNDFEKISNHSRVVTRSYILWIHTLINIYVLNDLMPHFIWEDDKIKGLPKTSNCKGINKTKMTWNNYRSLST